MAPSPERPQDTPNKEPPSDSNGNPFIRFRQFADAQIGSLLQGIIGLPSAFSKSATGNSRWADFDEELRRRDELQAKQKQLREADSLQSRGERVDGTKQSDEFQETNESKQLPQRLDDLARDKNPGNDVPLYSPVTKASFAHLDPGAVPEWIAPQTKSGLPSAYQWEFLPFEVRGDQQPLGTLQAVQFMAYNDLNRFPYLRSSYSLLPYLLFSPYSPIALEEEALRKVNGQNGGSTVARKPIFPFKDAFEDLIHTTQDGSDRRSFHFDYFSSFSGLLGLHSRPSTGVNNMGWIYNLYARNLLQERGHQELSQIRQLWHPAPFANLGLGVLQSRLSNRDVGALDQSSGQKTHDPETEQDMYDRFVRWASSPTEVSRSIDAFSKDPGAWFDDQITALESNQGRNAVRRVIETQFPKEVSSLFETLERWEKDASEVRSRRQQGNEGILEGLYDPLNQLETSARPSNDLTSDNANVDSSERSDKVVSTSTTTEHTTHEDGSVETNVTVWKRFADGRETTTTTNHYTNPPCDENGNPIQTRLVEPKEEVLPAGKKEKKGWFWN